MVATKRRLKKYVQGGKLAPYGEVAGELVDQFNQPDQNGVRSDFGSGLSGVLKGAGAGAAFGLPGAAIGAGLGLISSLNGNADARQEAERAAFARDKAIRSMSNARISTYDTTGSNSNQIYAKNGGAIPIDPENGGGLKPLSRESVEVEGPSHEEGGVQLSPEVEVEGDETIKNNFVYSDALPADYKGSTFADKHKKIARMIGKIEKKYNSPLHNSTLEYLNQKEEALKVQQETLKSMLGIKPVVR